LRCLEKSRLSCHDPKILNENSIDEKSEFVAMHTRDNAYGSFLKGTNYGGHNFRNSA
jgi:hypothetical protein